MLNDVRLKKMASDENRIIDKYPRVYYEALLFTALKILCGRQFNVNKSAKSS